MAKATASKKIVVSSVTLELSYDEAMALSAVLRRVGGSPDTTRRGLTAEIEDSLYAAGVRDTEAYDLNGTVNFEPKGE